MHSATRYAGVRGSNISSSSAATGLLWTGVLPALLVPVGVNPLQIVTKWAPLDQFSDLWGLFLR